MKAMANEKAVGPDGLPAELLKLGLQQDRTTLLIYPRQREGQQFSRRLCRNYCTNSAVLKGKHRGSIDAQRQKYSVLALKKADSIRVHQTR